MIKRLWRSGRLLILVILLTGLLLHLTDMRDSFDLLAPVYYLTPWPALALFSILAAIPFIEKRFLRWTLRFPLALFCLYTWLEPGFEDRQIEASPSDITVLFWNLQQKPHVNQALINVLTEERPDVAVFVERGDGFEAKVARYRELLPGYTIEGLDNLMMIFCRGQILTHDNVNLKSRSRYNRLEVLVDARRYVVYVVDIDPNVIRSRREPINEVRAAAAKETLPTVIAGDFNTPFGSAHFDTYRETFYHAFDRAGEGMMQTWPYFLPVYTLDHIWTSKDLLPVETTNVQKGFSSDHVAVMTRLRHGSGAAREDRR